MIYFIIILAALLLFLIIKNRGSNTVKFYNPDDKPTSTIFSNKQIIECKLAGASHQNLNRHDRKTSFGVAKLEPNNPVDKYAISVYNDKNKKVGYFPKGNLKLYKTIKTKYEGQLDLIVSIDYQSEGDNWWFVGNIIAPILYFEEEQKTVLEILMTYTTKGYRFSRKKQTTEEAWESLKIWEGLKEKAEQINFNISKYPEPDVSWIFKLSTDLLKMEDYKRLSYLENFEYLFDRLKPISEKNIYKRINIAKQKITK